MKRQDEPKVTLEARGEDARAVFADLFKQVDKDFVLNLPTSKPVYLTLREVPFLRALSMLCEVTQTRFAVREGVYYITPAEPEPRSTPSPAPTPSTPTPPAGKRVRLVGSGLTLSAIVQEIKRQAGVEVVLESGVPNLRMNLNLPSVSIEEALDAICRGTGLNWEKTEKGYRIRFEQPAVRPAPSSPEQEMPPLRQGTGNPRIAPSRPSAPGSSLRCPKCRYALQLDWRYCPICGAYVKHLTDRAKRELGQQ